LRHDTNPTRGGRILDAIFSYKPLPPLNPQLAYKLPIFANRRIRGIGKGDYKL